MQPRIRTLLILLSVSLNVAFIAAWGTKTFIVSTANAEKRQQRPCGTDSCRVWCPLHRELATTDSQWQVLEPLQREFQESSQRLSDSTRVLRAELIDLLAVSHVDSSALRVKEEQILSVQEQMQSLVVRHLMAEKSALTPEQQAKLFAMMRDRGGCAGHADFAGAGKRPCDKIETNANPK